LRCSNVYYSYFLTSGRNTNYPGCSWFSQVPPSTVRDSILNQGNTVSFRIFSDSLFTITQSLKADKSNPRTVRHLLTEGEWTAKPDPSVRTRSSGDPGNSSLPPLLVCCSRTAKLLGHSSSGYCDPIFVVLSVAPG
jgi:hypothetical protein